MSCHIPVDLLFMNWVPASHCHHYVQEEKHDTTILCPAHHLIQTILLYLLSIFRKHHILWIMQKKWQQVPLDYKSDTHIFHIHMNMVLVVGEAHSSTSIIILAHTLFHKCLSHRVVLIRKDGQFMVLNQMVWRDLSNRVFSFSFPPLIFLRNV